MLKVNNRCMSRLGVRKRLIMAYKITSSLVYEWKCAGELCSNVVSSPSLKASSAEKKERREHASAVLHAHGSCRQPRPTRCLVSGSST